MIGKLLLISMRGEKVPDGHSAPLGTRAGLIIFTQLLLLHLACRDWVRYVENGHDFRLFLALIFTGSFILSLGGTSELRLFRGFLILGRHAFDAARWIALAAMCFKFQQVFPDNPNHFYVEMFAILFLTLNKIDDEDQQLTALAALRWLPAIILFWSGLQKVLYGTYFDGSYLAYHSQMPRWAPFFDMVLPADELRRLSEQSPPGPYGFHSLTGLLMANVSYLSEIAVGILLLIRKTRTIAFCWACGLLLVMELGAREVFFGLLMLLLLLLYQDGRWLARWRWPAVCIYVYLVLAALKIVTGGVFN